VKYEVSGVSRPARALYQAMKAVMMPKTPPALPTVSLVNLPRARSRKVIVRKKNRAHRPPVERKVARKSKNVKMVHAMR